MSIQVLVLALIVSFSNVGLNKLTHVAAIKANSWLGVFGTIWFIAAFMLGTLSLASMATLYYWGKSVNLGIANVMPLMGAASISIGVLWGVYIDKNEISWPEIVMLLVVIIAVAKKMLRSTL